MLLIVVDACFVAAFLATGLLISYVFRDFSKRPGFVRVPSAFGHCFIGGIVGVLLLPNRLKWENDTVLPLVRELLGCMGFLIFTSRNMQKHTRNLKHNIEVVNETCKTDIEYSVFRSSVTRQQMQFAVGMGLSVLCFACISPEVGLNDEFSVAFWAVSTVHVLLGLIQLIAQHDTSPAYVEARRKFHGLLKWLHSLEVDGDAYPKTFKIFIYTYAEHTHNTPFFDRLEEEKNKMLDMGFDPERIRLGLVAKLADGSKVPLHQLPPEILQQHFPVTVLLAPPVSIQTFVESGEGRDLSPSVVPDFNTDVLVPMLVRASSPVIRSFHSDPEFA